MNHHHDERLDQAFGRLREMAIPPPPTNLEQNVWRCIRQSTIEPADWRPAFWPRWFTNPSFAAMIVFIGGIVGFGASSNTDLSSIASAEALPLKVFTESAPGMLELSFLAHHQ